jgi:hypothetical protein
MFADATTQESFFELRFSPDVSLVASVRRFVTEFYVRLLGDADVAHRVAMATHELLENTVSYSYDQRSEFRITVRRHGKSAKVALETKNRATPEQLALVRRALDEVVGAPDPAALYTDLMRRAAKRRDGGSGLGLGRIRAEADLTIDYEISGDLLTLTAHGTYELGGGSLPAIEEAG